jgi:flagellar basal-body rod protein FlgC
MINLIPGITSSASALNAERIRMEVVSQNIANANSSRGPDGQPYQRQMVNFESVLASQPGDFSGTAPTMVKVTGITSDKRPPRLVYAPDHPDADPSTKMVSLPDINIHAEMADLITSSRAFEANLAVVKNARSMALQTLSIGRR